VTVLPGAPRATSPGPPGAVIEGFEGEMRATRRLDPFILRQRPGTPAPPARQERRGAPAPPGPWSRRWTFTQDNS
jgi:hypothetical protein